MPGYYPGGSFPKKRTIYGSINLFSCSEDAIKGGILRIATEKGSQLEELQIYSNAISSLYNTAISAFINLTL